MLFCVVLNTPPKMPAPAVLETALLFVLPPEVLPPELLLPELLPPVEAVREVVLAEV